MNVVPLDLKANRWNLEEQRESRRGRVHELRKTPICFLSNDELDELQRLRRECDQIHNELLRRPPPTKW